MHVGVCYQKANKDVSCWSSNGESSVLGFEVKAARAHAGDRHRNAHMEVVCRTLNLNLSTSEQPHFNTAARHTSLSAVSSPSTLLLRTWPAERITNTINKSQKSNGRPKPWRGPRQPSRPHPPRQASLQIRRSGTRCFDVVLCKLGLSCVLARAPLD
jgi:hypothetical protein